MVSIERFMELRMKQIKGVINKGLKEIVAKEIKDTIIYRLETNFYDNGYANRGDLAKSISVNVLGGYGNQFTVEVYFDDEKIRHKSWFGSENLGISAGDISYTVQWINDGWTYIRGSTSVRLMDVGLTPHFLEDALNDLEKYPKWKNNFYEYLRKNGIEIE